MKFYVKHCPITCGPRRAKLEEHFKKRGVTDVEWFTDFPKDDPYVVWFHNRLEIKSGIAFTSGAIKTYEMFRNFVESGEKAAFFADDDIVLIKNWESIKIPDLPFVNMSVGVNFDMLPDGIPRKIINNGGCELMYVTRAFAYFILDHVDLRQTFDIVLFKFLQYSKFQATCVPIAQQTSLLEKSTSALGESGISSEWANYMKECRPSGVKYEKIRSEYFSS
jgi:hypothetical protein